jgi:hypothetical protein
LLFAQRNQLHIVHHNELIEVRQQLVHLVGRNLKLQSRFPGKGRAQQLVFLMISAAIRLLRRVHRGAPLRRLLFARPPNRQVALDVSLRIQHQVPGPSVGKKIVDGISHHAAQPAESVGPAHIHAPHPAQVVQGSPKSQCLCFHLGCVQLSWGQRAVVNGQLVRRVCGFQQGGQRSGLKVWGEVRLEHRGVSGVPAPHSRNSWRRTAS